MEAATTGTSGSPRAWLEPDAEGRRIARLDGNWTLTGLGRSLPSLYRRLDALAAEDPAGWDLSGIGRLDTAAALLLWRAWGESYPDALTMNADHRAVLERVTAPRPLPVEPSYGPLTGLGRSIERQVRRFGDHVRDGLTLPGQLLFDLAFLAREPGRIPWREISATTFRAGAQALPITALVGLLIGVVVSYLSAIQLKAYGAEAFIVDILGISVVRELGPLLAAILVAGRSGSAITGGLGVMRVTEELDALAAMGISPTLRLVLPKVVALSIAVPLLVLWTSAIALLGGMLSARAELGIGLRQFIAALPAELPVENFWIALSKGVVFGALIALTACHFGLRITPSSESLGRETTNSVVTAITLVILVDAMFAIALQGVGYA